MSLQRMPPQIVRASVPAVDPAAPRSLRSWEWVCSALVNKDKGECAIEILDTVFIQREQIWSWFYSSSGGVVRKKAQRKLTAANVSQRFANLASSYDQNAGGYVAICWFEDQRRLQLFTASDCQAFLTSCNGVACLSAFAQPRGELDPTRYANLEHEYTLHKSGRVQCKLFRQALGNQKILSMDTKFNTAVSSMVQDAISFIERTRKCRVVSCTAHLVMDDFGRVMLWKTEDFQTIAPVNSNVGSDAMAAPAYEGPHAVCERVLARARADAAKKPDETLIQAILSSPTPVSRRQTLLLQSSASQPMLSSPATQFDPFADDYAMDRKQSRSQLRSKNDWDEATQFLPTSSSLSRGRKRTLSAAHLVSSQKRGCCGDYCDTDVRKWTSKRIGAKPMSIPIASAVTGDASVKKGFVGTRSNSVISATTAASAFLTAHPDSTIDEVLGKKPMSPQRQQMEDVGKGTGGDLSVLTPHRIPFKLIAQTRAEKQLVDLFIRRYQKGEDGDYLAEVYYGDGEPLGQTFPGYYYQEVQACANCFAFYTLVEDVRMKALGQLDRRRSSSRFVDDDGRRASRQGGSRGLEPLHEDREDNERESTDRQAVELAIIARGLYKHAWSFASTKAAPALSKKDAAELFSFVNPHPAVTMVINALGILILGRDDVGPSEFKRAISQDKLLVYLQQFDLEKLQHTNAERAAAHARNPLFSPEHIGPISSCAGRFCDWILTVLQAYAWKNYQAFRNDPETWEMLAFMKPDLSASRFSREAFVEGLLLSQTDSLLDRNLAAVSDSTAKKKVAASAVARRAIQNQQMARLAAPTGVIEATTLGGNDAVFVCADGVTKIPYTITGQAVGGSTKCNLVVFNDFFDTMENTKVFFRPIVAKHVGARALFFNLPGQAGSQYPGSDSEQNRAVLNNVWYAQRVHELLQHLQGSSTFITMGLPFGIVGFGNGANIASSFAIQYGKHKLYAEDFQSLVLLNGFARLDAQLAGILHSAVNVFSCFPPNRPDLPVTFFCKYLFSEGYLSKVDINLALSIYTAVTNPISLDGRIRICQGALHHVDLSSDLPRIAVPLVLVQSVENLLVAPTSVDPFLQQRVNIAHSWSHQQQTGEVLPTKTKRQLQQVLSTPGSAFVSWLRAGHELRQEAKHYVVELLEHVVCAKESSSRPLVNDRETPSPLKSQAHAPGDAAMSLEPIEQASRATGSNYPKISPTTAPTAAAPPSPTAPLAVKSSPSQSTCGRENEQGGVADSMVKRGESVSKVKEVIAVRTKASSARLDQVQTRLAQAVDEGWNNSANTPAPAQTSISSPSVTPQPALTSVDTAVVSTTKFEPAIEIVKLARPALPIVEMQIPSVVINSLPDTQQAYHETIDAEIEAVRARMEAEEKRLLQQAEELRQRQRVAAEERMEALQQEQDRRRRQWEEEDNARLAALERKLQEEQLTRDEARRQRDQELLAADKALVKSVDISAVNPVPQVTTSELPNLSSDLVVSGLEAMKQNIRAQPGLPSLFDQMEAEEKAKKRVGTMRVDDFDAVKKSMTHNFNHHVKEHESTLRQELLRRKQGHAICIQKHIRRFLAVRRVAKIRHAQQELRIRRFAGEEIVRIVRGFLGRRRFVRHRRKVVREAQERGSAIAIQRLFRGFVCRVKFRRLLRNKKTIVLQRVYRGHRGRLYCAELRESQLQKKFLDRNAAKLQATWRMYVACHRFLTQRIAILAANEIQRMYRGHLGRIEAKRKKSWRDAEPGPERLALGLKMIEGSKQAFERQQNEIDALHRAQEAVERHVSTIHADLQDSEKELAILERELQEIDQLEADLRELTHEAEMLHNGGLEGILRSTGGSDGQKAAQPLGSGVPPLASTVSGAIPSYEKGIEDVFEGRSDMKTRQADAYAVEMAIQIKRAEREKKKKDLEAEFTSVFAEVQQKRQLLGEMEEKLADMEATRMRKDREFARMQRNLMELLEEQKLELENLREKGIELETATATSAAAAAATAMKAKEHEKRSQAMFESTEELMKFQFMSMSLSYFSSLNMLKNLRDINADTTAAAITSTAETAAAAAAAAAAANIPTMKRLQVGGSDLMMAASQLKKAELEKKLKEEEDAKQSNQQPLPDQVKDWTVDDVGRWLDSLSLSMYKKAFCEGAVDGEFLLELRAEDMSDVLGVAHKLHVRKIIVARNKLLPLTQQEQLQIDAVEHEEQARNARQGPGSSTSPAALDHDTVFSQARNGRMKRLVESVDAGFDINAEDDKGNTLLLIACQNVNIKMVEYLVTKRANVNHKNAQGNTPLHFAMAYDTEGKLGEYLIAHGADDTIENSFGLTAYDGLQPE